VARGGLSARAQRDERRADVERRLVATLKRLMVDQPRFTDLTLVELLSETGISRTSFYKYFESKGDVLAAWFTDTVEQLLAAPRPHTGPGAPCREDLRLTMQQVADVYRAELSLMAAVYETAAHDFDMRERLAEALKELEGRVRRHIVRGMREDWINPELDAPAMAIWIVSLCEAGLRHIIGPAAPAALPEAIAAGADMLWFTLYAPVHPRGVITA
jgi:TetR/AcrR family transcriptional regulator, ethionamide resistance regulator